MNKTLTTVQQKLYDWIVEYIRSSHHAPSVRQMMAAMNKTSPAPIQSCLDILKKKGYINWIEGRARTIRILQAPKSKGIQVLGTIAAGGLVEPFTDLTRQYTGSRKPPSFMRGIRQRGDFSRLLTNIIF
ncbi:MAG: hypothetical protein GDA44_07855, partial [Prochloron sp. SP5CPC1]|nr:hypothetical protein [Candidatus Paraprochloron terpiosi SP5CPC1]